MDLSTRKLDRWPGDMTPAKDRRPSPFRATWEQTRRSLVKELRHLGSKLAVLEVAVLSEREISAVTGFPRVEARVEHPGVILAADTKHGPLKWRADALTTWTANVRAIALTLERLRLADLYGVTRRGEQYAGWKMLPGPITGAGPVMTIEQAASFIGDLTGQTGARILASREVWADAYRRAVARLHPDKHAGQVLPAWARLQDAQQLLDGLHNKR